MAAKPAQLMAALDHLIARSGDDLPGAFPAGPACGTEYLPEDPVIAMGEGRAHPVPLIVGSNADEGRLFTRFMPLLPTNESMIEKVLANTAPGVRDRVTSAYPGYPDSADACIKLGGDFAFGTAAWQIAEAHSRHIPTYMYRYDYAPRALQWAGLGPTHATELLAVFDFYRSPGRIHAHRRARSRDRRCGSATTCRIVGAPSPGVACPVTGGRSTARPTVRCWCSTGTTMWSSTLAGSSAVRGRASRCCPITRVPRPAGKLGCDRRQCITLAGCL